MKKWLLFTLFSIFIFINLLTVYILSMNMEFDGWGNDFSANEIFLILSLTSLIFVILGVIGIIYTKRSKPLGFIPAGSVFLAGFINIVVSLSNIIDFSIESISGLISEDIDFNGIKLYYYILWLVIAIFTEIYGIMLYKDTKKMINE